MEVRPGDARRTEPTGDIHRIRPAHHRRAPREYHEGAGWEPLVHGTGSNLWVLGTNREGDDLGHLHVLPAPLGSLDLLNQPDHGWPRWEPLVHRSRKNRQDHHLGPGPGV